MAPLLPLQNSIPNLKALQDLQQTHMDPHSSILLLSLLQYLLKSFLPMEHKDNCLTLILMDPLYQAQPLIPMAHLNQHLLLYLAMALNPPL